jgi:flagellin-like protein
MWRVSASSERGQSETLGVILILAITVAGTGLILGFGDGALEDTRSSTEIKQAELAMTVFDSRAAKVALGDSAVQTVDFGGTTGTLDPQPGQGQITIKHVDYDGSNDEVLYQNSLGSLTYENDDTKLVYQGGGVWRQDANGGVSMVSPPEFHYRGSTLTLPLVRVTGSGGASGSSAVRVKSASDLKHVYPDASKHYDGDPTKPAYVNPSENGRVEIVVESEYYEGWADYFRERTNADVDVDHGNEAVTVELISTGNNGFFKMPGEDGSVDVRGVGGHGMENFEVTLRPDDTDSANFANLKWSMYVDNGATQFEIHVQQNGGSGCDAVASVAVYYSSDDGDTEHGWYDGDAFEAECGDYNDDGDDEVRMVLDFVDDDSGDGSVHDIEGTDPELEYVDLSNSQIMTFNPKGTPVDPVALDGHGGSVTWESKEYDLDDGDRETLDRIVNHYGSEMGGFDLTVDDKSSNSVNEGASYGTIDYGGGGKYITYLHITENEIEVETN